MDQAAAMEVVSLPVLEDSEVDSEAAMMTMVAASPEVMTATAEEVDMVVLA